MRGDAHRGHSQRGRRAGWPRGRSLDRAGARGLRELRAWPVPWLLSLYLSGAPTGAPTPLMTINSPLLIVNKGLLILFTQLSAG